MLVVHNTASGASDDLGAALDVLGEVEVVSTSGPEALDRLVRREEDLVVVAGGDGTLHLVVQALHRHGTLARTTLGLIPLGTGNDFARGAGVPLDVGEAARLVRAATPRAVDLLVDDAGGVVVNAVHAGVGVQASRKAVPWKPVLGSLAYVVGAARAAVRPDSLRLRVVADGRVVSDGRTLQVAIGNAPYVGGGTPLTPEADARDGIVDVLVSHALSPTARVAYVFRLRRAEHHRRDDVDYLQASTVTVSGEPFHVSADGELGGPLTERTWHVERAAFRMLLPPRPGSSSPR